MPIDFFEGHTQLGNWGGRVNTYVGSTVFKKTLASCAVLVIYVALGQSVENYLGFRIEIPGRDGAVFGAALSILMVLRTNTAYDRWWEGRKLWGGLVNHCRNLALKISVMSEASEDDKRAAGRWVAMFPYTMRDHLRHGILDDTLARLPETLPPDVRHVPVYISGRLFETLKSWRDQGHLNKMDHHLIDQHVSALMDLCGACERIRNTPLPLAHRALIPQLLVLYLVVVPLSLDLTWANAFLTFVMGYFLIGIELVAEHIEEPFGTDEDDLPLDQICENIERSIAQILPPSAPVQASESIGPTVGEGS